MRYSTFLLTGLALFTCFALSVSLTNWEISEDYQLRFSGTNASGSFNDLQGTINFDPDQLAASSMSVSVDVSTISTGNSTKDKHARGESWFNAEEYPKITFQSKEFRKATDSYQVLGDLTLHGTTRRVTIPFSFEETSSGGLFVGSFTVNRQDYGLTGPWLAFTVGDEFKIDLRVPVE